MDVNVWVSEIEFNGNQKIQLSKNDIVVFVGPNNAGKSASLREIANLLRSKESKNKVVEDINIEKEGDEIAILSLLESVAKKNYSNGQETHYQGFGFSVYIPNLKYAWNNYNKGLGDFFPLFVNMLSTETRLGSANPPGNIQLTTQPPAHPIHFLQRDDSLEEKFSNYFNQAFGDDLLVHRNAGGEVPLYVGKKPLFDKDKNEDRVSLSYLEKLEKLDLLYVQGDGMRSFVGVLLNAFISYYSVLLIDEPEAFLHPPQARLLGKMLAKDLPSDRQLFLATHSEDFLKGLLENNSHRLKIVRIQRNGLTNDVSLLDSEDIHNIWNDSLLRHSDVLNGLFHSKVIICESDSDCRFYSAVISAMYEAKNLSIPDMLFIHCGGKHRIPTVVRALVKLNVAIKVIVDFDVLNDLNPLKDIFENFGGIWSDIESDWKQVKNAIEQRKSELEKQELQEKINAVFDSINEKNVPKNKISDIQKLLARASAWSYAKDVGKAFIPNGDPTKAYERLDYALKKKGIYIVDIGQLESFDRSVGNHGPKWVIDVLEKDLANDPALENARRFVDQVLTNN